MSDATLQSTLSELVRELPSIIGFLLLVWIVNRGFKEVLELSAEFLQSWNDEVNQTTRDSLDVAKLFIALADEARKDYWAERNRKTTSSKDDGLH